MSARARVVSLLAALPLLAPASSQAAFHIAVIDEVMSGTGGDPNVQYVEIRMLAGGQNFVCHSRLTVFECASNGGGSHVLIGDLSNGNAQPCLADSTAGHRWIMASPSGAAFLMKSGVTPDFTWDNGATGSIPTSCGMVCWGAPGFVPPNPPTWDATLPGEYVDCVAYGSYDGPSEPLGNPPAAATPGDGTFSLTRTGEEMFSNNFQLACPSPTASGGTQTPGSFGACPPPSTTTTTVATSTTVTTTSFSPATSTTAGTATTTTTTTTSSATTATTSTTVTSTTTTIIAPAAGQPVAGTRLLLKANPSKPAKNALVLVAKDAGLVAGDPTQTGGSVRVSTAAGDGFDTNYSLPASRWKPIGKGKGYRFKDPTGPIRSVVVKPGKMAKAIGKGSGLRHTLAGDPNPVTVLLAVGTQRDCMSFAGGKFVAGKKYLATNDPPPAACP